MANDRMVGMVQTVQGPIRPEQLGVTHTHEHILSDASGLLIAPEEASAKDLYCRPLSADTAGYIRHYADTVANSDDMSNGDVSVAIEEVGLFKQYGGDSPVDATPIGLGRDPVALARVSRATGVNIVMGAAYYVYKAHPPDMDSRSEDDLADQIVRDVTEGVDGTGIKSGVIGEVGCSWPLKGQRAQGAAGCGAGPEAYRRANINPPRPQRNGPSSPPGDPQPGGNRSGSHHHGPHRARFVHQERPEEGGRDGMLYRVGPHRRGEVLLRRARHGSRRDREHRHARRRHPHGTSSPGWRPKGTKTRSWWPMTSRSSTGLSGTEATASVMSWPISCPGCAPAASARS